MIVQLIKTFCLLGVLIYASMAIAMPPLFKTVYQVSRDDNIFGEVTVRSQHNGDNQLVFDGVFIPQGFLGRLFSQVNKVYVEAVWHDGRIVPGKWEHFAGKKKNLYIFEPDNFLVSVQHKNESYIIPLSSPRIFDQLSMIMQFVTDAGHEQEVLSYDAVSKGKLRRYVFVNKGKETITTRLGDMETIRFHGFRKGKLKDYYWLSPDYKNLVVKMQRVDDGNIEYSVEIVNVQLLK